MEDHNGKTDRERDGRYREMRQEPGSWKEEEGSKSFCVTFSFRFATVMPPLAEGKGIVFAIMIVTTRYTRYYS